MAKDTGSEQLPPNITMAKRLADRWGWLSRLLVGKQPYDTVIIQGFSVRIDAAKTFVVVRALRIDNFSNVVAFGSADNLYDALRNVTAAMAKGEWKKDKFRQVV